MQSRFNGTFHSGRLNRSRTGRSRGSGGRRHIRSFDSCLRSFHRFRHFRLLNRLLHGFRLFDRLFNRFRFRFGFGFRLRFWRRRRRFWNGSRLRLGFRNGFGLRLRLGNGLRFRFGIRLNFWLGFNSGLRFRLRRRSFLRRLWSGCRRGLGRLFSCRRTAGKLSKRKRYSGHLSRRRIGERGRSPKHSPKNGQVHTGSKHERQSGALSVLPSLWRCGSFHDCSL